MRRGASAVEFALTLPILFVLLSAMLDLGAFLSQQYTVLEAGRDAVRLAVRDATDPVAAAELAAASARGWLDALAVPCGEGCRVEARPIVIAGYDAVELELTVPVRPVMGVLVPRSAVQGRFTMLLE